MNVLKPDKIAHLSVDFVSSNDSNFCQPKVCLNDRILILRDESHKIQFYDILRQKFVAECELEVNGTYHVVGDDLIIESDGGKTFKKITLPFYSEARNGDFRFYTPIDSILPNPFTSVIDLKPNQS